MKMTCFLKDFVALKLLVILPELEQEHGIAYAVFTFYTFGSAMIQIKSTISAEHCDDDCSKCNEFYSAYDEIACCHSNWRFDQPEKLIKIVNEAAALGYNVFVCDA